MSELEIFDSYGNRVVVKRSELNDLKRQLEEAREESKFKKELISQTSKICLLLQMGRTPSQEDFRELMSLERAYRTFEEF